MTCKNQYANIVCEESLLIGQDFDSGFRHHCEQTQEIFENDQHFFLVWLNCFICILKWFGRSPNPTQLFRKQSTRKQFAHKQCARKQVQQLIVRTRTVSTQTVRYLFSNEIMLSHDTICQTLTLSLNHIWHYHYNIIRYNYYHISVNSATD